MDGVGSIRTGTRKQSGGELIAVGDRNTRGGASWRRVSCHAMPEPKRIAEVMAVATDESTNPAGAADRFPRLVSGHVPKSARCRKILQFSALVPSVWVYAAWLIA